MYGTVNKTINRIEIELLHLVIQVIAMNQVKVICIFLMCLSFCFAVPLPQDGGLSFAAMDANQQQPQTFQDTPNQPQIQIQANMGSDMDISDLAL